MVLNLKRLLQIFKFYIMKLYVKNIYFRKTVEKHICMFLNVRVYCYKEEEFLCGVVFI